MVRQLQETTPKLPKAKEPEDMKKLRNRWKVLEPTDYWINKVMEMGQTEALYPKGSPEREYYLEKQKTLYELEALEYEALKEIMEKPERKTARLKQLEREQEELKKLLASLEAVWEQRQIAIDDGGNKGKEAGL